MKLDRKTLALALSVVSGRQKVERLTADEIGMLETEDNMLRLSICDYHSMPARRTFVTKS